MIETNIKNLSVEEIMQKIKQEVQKRKNNDAPELKTQTQEEIKQDLSAEQTKLEPKQYKFKEKNSQSYKLHNENRTILSKRAEDFLIKEHYEYADFTKYHDVEFVQNIYRALLKREADNAGLNNYLNLLRSGVKSKSEIISLLRFSKEGRNRKVKLLGFGKRFLVTAVYATPVLGYIAKSLLTLFTLPKLLKRLNSYESYVSQEAIMSHHNDLLLSQAINTKTDKTEVEQLANELQSNIDTKTDKTEVEQLANELQSNIDTKAERIVLTEEEKHKFDTFYVEFEDRFRGTREEIKERVKVYLPYIENLPFKKEEVKALDVGCGRGEWIELLSEQGYDVQGIDLNSIMVTKSQELGLDVEQADVIEYLESLEKESLSVITGFHIIEHLPFEVLMKMYDEALRVLKSGGIVIFETPNPENLMVGACNFYGDPTHLNPLPPHASNFLIEQRGFKDVSIKRLHPPENIHYEDPLINHQFAVGQDYAIIGYKL